MPVRLSETIPRHLWTYAVVRDETCRGVHWISWRTFWALFFKCTLSTIISKINVSGHMLISTFFLVLVYETCVQNLSTPFTYTLCKCRVCEEAPNSNIHRVHFLLWHCCFTTSTFVLHLALAHITLIHYNVLYSGTIFKRKKIPKQLHDVIAFLWDTSDQLGTDGNETANFRRWKQWTLHNSWQWHCGKQ
jgi:hypothetical protein